MATLVGSAGWREVGAGVTWALPAGTQPGDLIVAVRVGQGVGVPPGFTAAVSGRLGVLGWLYRGGMEVSTRWATAGMTQVKWPGDRSGYWVGIGAVFVLRGTTGVGTVRSNVAAVSVRDGGAAVFLAAGYSAPGVPSGPSWGASGSVSKPERSIEFHGRWGWQDAPPGGGTLGGEVSPGWGVAIELLPPAEPFAPEPVTPEDGVEVTVAADAPLTVGWRHRPSRAGGSQSGFELRVIRAGVTRYWSVAGQVWSASAVINPGSAQQTLLPSSALVLGQDVQWQVRTRETLDGQWSLWSPPRTFTRVAPPTVTVTGPTGTVTDDLAPWVTWTPTTPRGVQTAYRVEVLSAADVPLWDSGVIAGSGTSLRLPPTIEWQRLAVHQVRVTVQQSGGSWSLPGTRSWTMTWTQPAEPVVALDLDGPGVGIEVTAISGLAVEVQRSAPGGQWVPWAAWTASGVDSGRDVFAPYGQPVTYRVHTGSLLDGQPMWSDWVTSAPVTSLDDDGYIASAVDPATTWQQLHLTADRQRIDQEPIAVTYGLGDSRPRVSHGPARGQSGELSVWSEHRTGTDALRGLLGVREPLLLRLPPDRDCLVDLPEVLTVARSAQVGRDRLIQAATHRGRIITFAWVEQEPPALGASMAPVVNPIIPGG